MLTIDINRVDWQALTHFLYARDEGVDARDILDIFTLSDKPHKLREVWSDIALTNKATFTTVVEEITDYTCVWCEDCSEPAWDDEITSTYNGSTICETCRDYNYACCEICEEYFRDYDVTSVDGTYYCERNCLGENCTWCEDCDEYYSDDYSGDHRHGGCECEAPRRKFAFPANGRGTVTENERLAVNLPSGTISQEGIWEVYQAVVAANLTGDTWSLRKVVESLDPEWQKKAGNFTRRLSKALYQQLGLKVPASLMSEVGNIARRHTSDVSTMWVEFTRDLNGTAEEFYHDDSCWWGGNSESRCALKSWGGIGIRTYSDEDEYTGSPSGRAWVQPLDENMKPTHETTNAHAYVVYNGYGNLEGYIPARIVAHLTGRTYRKIEIQFSPQYVNNSTGYLIADEETCNKTACVSYSADEHYTTDHKTLEVAA